MKIELLSGSQTFATAMRAIGGKPIAALIDFPKSQCGNVFVQAFVTDVVRQHKEQVAR